MENNSEAFSLDKSTRDSDKNHVFEIPIPLTPCSNIHLLKQLQIFLHQNTIPIEITTTPSSIQTGGRERDREKTPFVYQSETTPFTIFKSVMDSFFLQKQHENTEDKHNKQLLDSMFSKDKSKTEIIHSLQTLSEKQSREEQEEEEEKEPEKEKEKEPEKKTEEHKKKYIPLSDTNTLYMHIKTNHPTPIESIQGTKLYYLYQRQQKEQNECAQFV